MSGAAFFCLDRCVISGSSIQHFGRAILKWGAYKRADLVKGVVRDAGRAGHDPDGEAIRRHLLAAVDGCSAEQIDLLIPEALGAILAEVREDMYMRILEHEADGIPTYLCSPSPVQLVEVVADVLNMSGGVLATSLATDESGRFTGELSGPFTYAGGVAESIAHEAAHNAIDLSKSWGYGHAPSDIPLLESVGNPVVVNPDGQMITQAAAKGWDTIDVREASSTRKKIVTAGVASGAAVAAAAAIAWALRRR